MAPVDLQSVAIDPGSAQPGQADTPVQEMLKKLQGNILTSHGRDQVRLIFLSFKAAASPTDVSAWIRSFAPMVTSARRQLDEADVRARTGQSGGLFASFFLTAAGYRAGLRLPIERFPEGAGPPALAGVRFQAGMAAARTALNDPDPAGWEAPYRPAASGASAIHAMILLADDNDNARRLEEAVGSVRQGLARVANVLRLQNGKVLRAAGQRIEPFGFADGLSQPLFLLDEVRAEKARGNLTPWTPAAPLALALLQDPFAGENCFGSYLVLRKLEQNVKLFRQQEKALAKQLGLTGLDRDRAGAMVIGRFRDGTPLVQAGSSNGGPANNSFNYESDLPPSSKCPRHAHMRVVNPRSDLGSSAAAQERMHRIVRRGVPYDDRPEREAGQADPEKGVGLLFMCYQSDISRQFGFLQNQWIGGGNGSGTTDCVLAPAVSRDWAVKWSEGATRPFAFQNCVRPLGGEFFFAPSLPFLQNPPTGG